MITFDNLPTEILILIFSHVSPAYKCRLCLCCRRLKDIIYLTSGYWNDLNLSPFWKRLKNEHLISLLRTRWRLGPPSHRQSTGRKLDLSGCYHIQSHVLEIISKEYFPIDELHLNRTPRYETWINDPWLIDQYYTDNPAFNTSGRLTYWNVPSSRFNRANRVMRSNTTLQIGVKAVELALPQTSRTLRSLSLAGLQFHQNAKAAMAISSCTQLTELDLSGTDMNIPALRYVLASLKKLESLKLLDVLLDPFTMIIIEQLTSLRLLHVSASDITTAGIDPVARIVRKLHKLEDFRLNQIIGKLDLVIDGLRTRTSLKHLELSPKTYRGYTGETVGMADIKLSNMALSCLATHHLNLVTLRIINASQITARGLDNLLCALRHLEVLELRRCETLWLDPLRKLTPEYCPLLRILVLNGIDIYDYSQWTDGDRLFEYLEVLDIMDTPGFNTQVMNRLLDKSKKLKKLRFYGTTVDEKQIPMNKLISCVNKWWDVKFK
ncbi:10674_t:CDS:1 [Paraglomus brasilianum]|uniref:10674_t:CDS:1 n=1 Tax=Paraglomus brasilianum TaxID=144538 RepID=A0A9N9CJM8_9GLOM|nr:10674_t:CDS:1 [Paraglomus brasilianum]